MPLNMVCILLSERMHQPVIGLRFAHCPFFVHVCGMELAALGLHVSSVVFKCQIFLSGCK